MHELRQKYKLLWTLAVALPIVTVILIYNVTHNALLTAGSALISEIPVVIYYFVLKNWKTKREDELGDYLKVVDYTKKMLEQDSQVKEAARKNSYQDKDYDEVDAYANDKRRKQKDFDFYIEENFRMQFIDTLNYFIEKHNQVDVSLLKVVDRELLTLIKDPNYQIAIEDVYYMAIVLELTPFETDQLLSSANYSYDSGNEFDVAMLFFIKNNMTNIELINCALEELGINKFNKMSK